MRERGNTSPDWETRVPPISTKDSAHCLPGLGERNPRWIEGDFSGNVLGFREWGVEREGASIPSKEKVVQMEVNEEKAGVLFSILSPSRSETEKEGSRSPQKSLCLSVFLMPGCV